MSQKIWQAIFFCFSISIVAFCISSNSNGPGGDRTGAPLSSGNCTSCHSAGSNRNGSVKITVVDKSSMSVVTSIEVGKTYIVSISTLGNSTKKGFQATVLNSSNIGIGIMASATGGASIYKSGSREICGHNTPSLIGAWTFEWTAPAALSGDVKIYAVSIVSNADGSNNGDQTVSTNITLTPKGNSSSKTFFGIESINTYPNPSSMEINLPSFCISVQIVGINGKQVYCGTDVHRINIENLAPGLYFLNGVKENGKPFVGQFVKQ